MQLTRISAALGLALSAMLVAATPAVASPDDGDTISLAEAIMLRGSRGDLGTQALATAAPSSAAPGDKLGRKNAVATDSPELAKALRGKVGQGPGDGITTLARGEGPFVVYISGVRVELSFAEQWLDRGGEWFFGNSRLTMQWDGNLVIYNRYTGAVKWSPNIYNQGGVRMLFQTDDNLVVYRSNGTPVWATNKFCSGSDAPMIGLQGDGNYVVYCGFIYAGEAYVYAIRAAGTNF